MEVEAKTGELGGWLGGNGERKASVNTKLMVAMAIVVAIIVIYLVATFTRPKGSERSVASQSFILGGVTGMAAVVILKFVQRL